jgi:hypothetical protein
MSTKTPKLGLTKPELTDAADITAFNRNWDVIESKLTVMGLINGSNYTFDTALEQGEYNVQAADADGAPYTGTLYGKLIVILNDGTKKSDANWIWQEFLPASASKQRCWRMKINTEDWTDWFIPYDSGHKPTLTELGAASENHKHPYTINIGYDRIDINSNADLNDILDMGCYRCTTANKASSLLNCPTKNAFILDMVAATGGNITINPDSYAYAAQRIYDLDGKQYTRQVTSNANGKITYSNWVKIYSSVEKPTASDVGLGVEDISSKFTITPMGETGDYIGGVKRVSVCKQGNVISGTAYIDDMSGSGEFDTYLFNIPAEYQPKTSFVGLPLVCSINSGGFCGLDAAVGALQGTLLSITVFNYSVNSVQFSFNYICK